MVGLEKSSDSRWLSHSTARACVLLVRARRHAVSLCNFFVSRLFPSWDLQAFQTAVEAVTGEISRAIFKLFLVPVSA